MEITIGDYYKKCDLCSFQKANSRLIYICVCGSILYLTCVLLSLVVGLLFFDIPQQIPLITYIF